MEKCQNYRILIIHEGLVHFPINIHFVKAISRFEMPYNDSTDIEDVQRRNYVD